MAVIDIAADIAKRQFFGSCPSGYYRSGNQCYPRSNWYWWGRWVLAGVLIFVIFLVLLMCLNARRRRRRGLRPMYGTGWMANQNKYGQAYPQQNNGYGPNYQPPPPAYGQPPVQNQYTGTTFNPNDGYYGGHNEGIQLQQPPNSYQRDVYAPPSGPPPGK